MRTENYEGYTFYDDGRILGRRGLFLKPWIDTNGYASITIYNKGISKSICVHRIIAELFIPNPENRKFINHINSDRTDFRVKNLEWCTASENMIHAVKTGRFDKVIISVSNRRSKKVIDISTGKIYPSAKIAAASIGINRKTLVTRLTGHRKNNTNLKYL